MIPTDSPEPRSVGRLLTVILFTALFVRALALWAAWDAQLVLDEQLYVMRADALRKGLRTAA